MREMSNDKWEHQKEIRNAQKYLKIEDQTENLDFYSNSKCHKEN